MPFDVSAAASVLVDRTTVTSGVGRTVTDRAALAAVAALITAHGEARLGTGTPLTDATATVAKGRGDDIAAAA